MGRAATASELYIILVGFIGCTVAQYRPFVQGNQIRILSQTNEGPNPDGSYRWSYDTENGISAEEDGRVKNLGTQAEATEVRGSFRYIAPDNTPITVQYIANENGFQPVGAHLPTPPPIPPAILRSLEFIGARPQTFRFR
ncbi:hypothetical protein NQ317_004624 [Molorchus minor]|uniref:Uncharacterized protein n=1 Tax=Molorchus minor TaxID=1323400 RepID=A0ABQ9JJ49_9CUCU|nr:hypothetical protein NQ317_004624 [Molorchus minor]